MFQITKKAVQLYKDEMDLHDGDAIQLYVRYAGGSSGGYGLGINRATPSDKDYTQNIDGIIFFVEADDHWFVKDMILDYDTKLDRFICETPATA